MVMGWQQLEQQLLFDAEIEINGKTQKFQAGAITVANAAPVTSIMAQGTGRVVVDDGLLDVTIATAETKLQAVVTMLGMLESALIHTNNEINNVVHLQTSKIKISADPPQRVVLDGEIIGTTPLVIETVPQALTVIV